jgi:C4-dicarboxylate-specific signal transduction histidine kinase
MRPLFPYFVAAVSVIVATIVTLKLGPIIKHPSIPFFCSVMLSSWYGGLCPGLFAVVLSVISLDYYFLPPIYALGIGPDQAPDVITFVATALLISWLNANQKRAKKSLRLAHDQLDKKVRLRTAELEKANEQLHLEIAERQAAEERLIRAQTEMARMARITTMGEFAASIAHELNQPLGGIVTSGDACLRWLAAKPPNMEEAREAVGAIIRDGTRASNVLVRIRELLSRGERLRERLNINDIVKGVAALLEGELRRNAISLETDLSEHLPPVIVDRILLQQVVLNLVMNAIEAMRPVGDRARLLYLQTQKQPPGSIVVMIRDSGVGVDPENSRRIFKAFYTTKPEGIGMGLTISHSIIEAHGGRLWAGACDGPGSTFYFALPIEKGT